MKGLTVMLTTTAMTGVSGAGPALAANPVGDYRQNRLIGAAENDLLRSMGGDASASSAATAATS